MTTEGESSFSIPEHQQQLTESTFPVQGIPSSDTLTNPWNASPAVTMTTSELSAQPPVRPTLSTDFPVVATTFSERNDNHPDDDKTPAATNVMTSTSNNNTATTGMLELTMSRSTPITATQSEGATQATSNNTNAELAAIQACATMPTPTAQQQQHQQLWNPLQILDTTPAPSTTAGDPSPHANAGSPLMGGESQQPYYGHQQQQQHAMESSPGGGAIPTMSDHDEGYQEGGRLWRAAAKEAERQHHRPKKSRFAESLMERMRSRADPNALVTGSTTATGGGGKAPTMIKIGQNEESFILSSALAKKRIRVVQLLLIGLIGLLLGLLGNFFVSTSCHFATVAVQVGQNENDFEFHFGLWKYSPIDSVFQGYSYCYKYDEQYSTDAPIVARITNIVALIAGTLSIGILWMYLIFGYADQFQWKLAVWMAFFAGAIQLSTLYFFFGRLCQEYECTMGPAAILSILTSVVWATLAFEMQYHMPVAIYASSGLTGPDNEHEQPRTLVTNLEMSHLDEVTREYLTRVTGKSKDDELPGLNHTDLRRVRPKKSSSLYSPTAGGTPTSSLYQTTPRGTYQAPSAPTSTALPPTDQP